MQHGTTQPSITCPVCRRTSYHPQDIAHRYCGNCHQFHGTRTVRCESAGCRWAVHAGSAEQVQAQYAEHLRNDPRHTGGAWIDRDGRERQGLDGAGSNS